MWGWKRKVIIKVDQARHWGSLATCVWPSRRSCQSRLRDCSCRPVDETFKLASFCDRNPYYHYYLAVSDENLASVDGENGLGLGEAERTLVDGRACIFGRHLNGECIAEEMMLTIW